MIDISFSGLIGAFIGTAIAAFAYAPLVASIERHLRTRAAGEGAAEHVDHGVMQQEISLLRRACLRLISSCSQGLATGSLQRWRTGENGRTVRGTGKEMRS